MHTDTDTADPLEVVVVGLLGLDPLQDGLVLVRHPQQVTLSASLVQTEQKRSFDT